MPKNRSRTGDFMFRSVRHQIEAERYTAGVVRRMLALVARTDADLVLRIQALDPETDTRAQLEARLEALRQVNRELAQRLAAALDRELGDFAQYEAGVVRTIAQASFGVSWQGVTVEQVRAAALSRPFQGVHLRFANLGEHMDEFGERRGALVRDTIRKAFLEGRGIDETVRELRGTKVQNYRDGILETSRRTTETIVRTAMNHTATAAREEVYKVNAHLIASVQWISVIDQRTSAVCRAFDDQTFPVDSGPRPPAHPNCRSTTIPIFKGDEKLKRLSYGDWLKEQDRETVEDILGKRKAALFLDGSLTLDRFVDASGKEYNLTQLKAREATAWKKAGLGDWPT